MSIAYGIITLVSLCMVGACVLADKKRDVWLLLVFVSVSLCNLGYFMTAISKDLADALDMPDLPMDEFDTLGGLAVSTLDSYPEDGEQFECTVAGLHIKVLRIEERCVEEAVITRLPTPKEEDEDEDE